MPWSSAKKVVMVKVASGEVVGFRFRERSIGESGWVGKWDGVGTFERLKVGRFWIECGW